MENLYDEYSSVIELTNNSFIKKKDEFYLKNDFFKNKKGLIVFYAPWCGHCVNMKMTWIEISRIFKNKFSIGAVNCENKQMNNHKLRKNMKIIGYPTIKYVNKKGKIFDYNGLNSINELIVFICKKEKIKCS